MVAQKLRGNRGSVMPSNRGTNLALFTDDLLELNLELANEGRRVQGSLTALRSGSGETQREGRREDGAERNVETGGKYE